MCLSTEQMLSADVALVAALCQRIGQTLGARVDSLSALRFVGSGFCGRCALLHLVLLTLKRCQPRLGVCAVGVVLRVGDRVDCIGDLRVQIVEVAFDLGELFFCVVGIFDGLLGFGFCKLFAFGGFVALADLLNHDKSGNDDAEQCGTGDGEHPGRPLLRNFGASQLQLGSEALLFERRLMALTLCRLCRFDAKPCLAFGMDAGFFDGTLMLALGPDFRFLGFAQAALGFLLLLDARFLGAANGVLFLLDSGLFDLTELAEREQHGVLALVALSHTTPVVTRRKKMRYIGAVAMSFVDLHSHVLCGLDDGAADCSVSIAMLDGLAKLGISEQCVTPHQKASQYLPTWEAIEAAFAAVESARKPGHPVLRLGAENMWDDVFYQRVATDRIPHYRDTPAFLVEFVPELLPLGAVEQLFKFRLAGKVPVLAHPERYQALWDNDAMANELCQQCAFVVDLGAVAGYHGRRQMRQARHLLERGFAAAVATDAHQLVDIQRSQQGLEWIEKQLGHATVVRLFDHAPRTILAGELPDR